MIWLCLALCLLLPVAACAQAVQPDHAASLTLRLTEDGEGLAGATFEVYRVAEMDGDARFNLLPGYDAGEVDINKVEGASAWTALAEKLLAQAGEPTATVTTNDKGEATIASAKTGLYLVVGKPVEIGSAAYSFAPFMVSVPGKTGDNWQYSVVVDVKHERTPLTCDVTVIKVWKDEGYSKERPASILVDLYCDGVLHATVELNAGNNWTYVFTGLESAHEWTVQEQTVPDGYTAEYSQQDGALVITNTLTTPPTQPPKIPQTGLTWWPVPLMAVLGMTLVILGLVMRRKWSNEHDQA